MSNKKYSFWGLLNDYSIEIPIIQRDYAQGRKNEKVDFIRKGLLNNLLEALTKDEPLTFDFVYGNTKNEKFIPLDGQQRLTTLYLLHWYLAVKDKHLEENKYIFSKFSYETRISSRDFCNCLINKGIDTFPTAEETFSVSIENSSWFFMSWKKDPTINSMLNMLDSIHATFYKTSELFSKLIDLSKCPIFFQYIQLDDYGLTDSLYIKMNARGKVLTTFENLKVRMELLLETKFPALGNEFNVQVDGAWTDFFWNYKDANWLIDQSFVRYFNFIMEVCSYNYDLDEQKKYVNNEKEFDLDLAEKIFSKEENCKFLIDSLNLLKGISDISELFNSLFTGSEYVENKVALFEEDKDLFKRLLIAGTLTIKQKLLLYAVITGLLKNGNTLNDEFIDKIRIVRNLLERTRQRKGKDIITNLRNENYAEMLDDIKTLMTSNGNIYVLINGGLELKFFKEIATEEKEKASLIISNPELKVTIHQLEDHKCFKGTLFNLNISSYSEYLIRFKDSIYQIWNGDEEISSKIFSAMLSIEDYGIFIGGSYSIQSDRFYFGSHSNWHTILVDSDKIVKSVLPKFLIQYLIVAKNSPSNKLDEMRKIFLSSYTKKDWRYYFIKYPAIVKGNTVYAFPYDENPFNIRKLRYGIGIKGEQINPIFVAVAERVNDTTICDIEANYLHGYDEGNLFILTNGLNLQCNDDAWGIDLSNVNDIIKDKILSYSQLLLENGRYLLKENEERDRVEIAVDFLNFIVNVN